MKSLKFWLISLFSVITAVNASACWFPTYLPTAAPLFRVHNDSIISQPDYTSDLVTERQVNGRLWKELTHDSIPYNDIHHAVYKMQFTEFKQIYNNPTATYKNLFIEWITKNDREILDFLLLAKANEYNRLINNSHWHYPTMRSVTGMTLEEIADKALSATSPRLRDRYLLQAVRALFTLKRYQECVDIWNNEASKLPEDNLMRQIIRPYIAGAEFELNHNDEAMTHYAKMGDYGSLMYCSKAKGYKSHYVTTIELLHKYAPNSVYVTSALQGIVRSYEPQGIIGFDPEKTDRKFDGQLRDLRDLCNKIIRSKNCDNPAMWHYTLAFLHDLEGNTAKASQALKLAESARSTPFIDESIKVFRIYLDAKTSNYNTAYENKLHKQMQWLDGKIAEYLTDSVKNYSAGIFTACYDPYYYWNDAMRRILISEVCPRMLKAGRTTKALQMANMSENLLCNLVGYVRDYDWITDSVTIMSRNEFRYLDTHNPYDYSNHFFLMIDTIGIDAAAQYVQATLSPTTEFDRFINERSYVDSNYLNDIVGTLCLRHMRYADAVKYLGRVSPDFKKHLNVTLYCDPFVNRQIRDENTKEFKYDFACKMLALEQAIALTSDPTRNAQHMARFAIGLKNSFELCWPLTHYSLAHFHWEQACHHQRLWDEEEYTKTAIARANRMAKEALPYITDTALLYALNQHKTLAERHPDSPEGILVRGSCDKLYDYNPLEYYNHRDIWEEY